MDVEWLRREHQVKGRDARDLADELDLHEETVRRTLSALRIGTPQMLLREPGGPDELVEHHGSPAEAADATGIPVQRIIDARSLR